MFNMREVLASLVHDIWTHWVGKDSRYNVSGRGKRGQNMTLNFTINLSNEPNFIRPEVILHPPIPPEMHGLNPRSLMGQAEWDKVRKEAYAKNNHCCWACGVSKTEARYRQWLEAHELYWIDYRNGIMELKEIVALCHLCHQFVHYARARALAEMGKMPAEKFRAILAHGQKLIRDHNPKPWWDYDQMVKDQAVGRTKLKWGDWKLIFEGKEYHSKFKDKDAWNKHYTSRARTDE